MSLIFTIPIFVLSMIITDTTSNDDLSIKNIRDTSIPMCNLFL